MSHLDFGAVGITSVHEAVVLTRDFGRREGSGAEVSLLGAAVSTFREGKIARAEFDADRTDALEARALSE